GDPETQPVMSRLKTDLVELMLGAMDGRLHEMDITFDDSTALTVVLASGGYPGSYDKGKEITGLADVAGAKVFHAGTALDDGCVVTSGGRVLSVTALGGSVLEAQTLAYENVSHIRFEGAEYRKDIGYRAVAREKTN
ncbi:MAG: phosphoribosylamine--glycine ligase, partial [Gammaproteobacteria bacterium]|nr:phosphoribosylamine--glycine ligase [Gammaproteobacteria bacterium]